MKFPENPEDVADEIFISSDKSAELGDLRIRQLIDLLKKVDHGTIIEGVLLVFEKGRTGTHYRDQQMAGKVLEEINPASEYKIEAILKRALPVWDKSIRQLPVWLKSNYGADAVLTMLDTGNWSGIQPGKVATMKFWLQVDEKKS